MASTTPNTTGVIRYSEAEIDQKFEELRRKIPGLENFKRSSTALSVLLDLSNCHEQMLGILRDGFSDVCIPFWQGTIPNTLAPSRFNNIIQLQERFLLDYLPIPQGAERGKHFRLSNNHLQRDYNNPSLVPRGLKVVKTIGKGGYGFVDAVEDTSTRSQFALKRITRDADPKRSAEQLRYVTLELNALKKIRDQPTGGIHFVELVCGFTDPMFYGILMEPLADCNLDEFLQTFASTPQRDESLLATWYGCLATALAYLHFNLRIRHKDIKPQNILVIGRNVVFTDFGMALDWSESGQTTTNQEKLLSPRYAAPETDRDEPRNSSADIWPLGCVFLEMTAASKGWTRQDLDHFLMNPGSTVMRYVKNIKGIKDVIEELRRRQSRYGNAPLEWVEKMLQVDARSRPTARTLRSMIFESETAHCQLFCGICCRSMPWLPSTSVNSGPALGAILSEPQTLNFGGETRGEASPEYPPESVEAVESLQQHNNILATQELLNHGFEVLWPRSSGGLFWAAKEGKMDVIRLLLRHGADLSATNSEGTLAHSAAAGGHVEVLQLLLENQIPLDQRQQYPDGWTPLHSAVKCKQESAVAFLLQQGAHPNTKVENGWTALHCSAEQGSTGIAKILLENGARVTAKDLKGSTPLHRAAMRDRTLTAELLLEKKANINERDTDVRTPLHIAVRNSSFSVARLLLEKGADVDTQDSDGGNTPLHFAAGMGQLDLVRLLMQHKADINKTNDMRSTPLWLAVRNSKTDVARFLVDSGADTNKANHHGFSPLLLAASGEVDIELVRLLLQSADVERKASDGKTALHMAASENQVEAATLILEHAANKESTDENGWTPLHWAANRGHADVARVLLEYGADSSAKDSERLTPRQMARERGHLRTLNILEADWSSLTGAGNLRTQSMHEDWRLPLRQRPPSLYKTENFMPGGWPD